METLLVDRSASRQPTRADVTIELQLLADTIDLLGDNARANDAPMAGRLYALAESARIQADRLCDLLDSNDAT